MRQLEKLTDYGIGDEMHESMIELCEYHLGLKLFPTFEFERNYQENGFIYDLYINDIDCPIEIGNVKIEKLNWLLMNKEWFGWCGTRRLWFHYVDWFSRGKNYSDLFGNSTDICKKLIPKVMIYHLTKTGSIFTVFTTRHNLPGFKYVAELVKF